MSAFKKVLWFSTVFAIAFFVTHFAVAQCGPGGCPSSGGRNQGRQPSFQNPQYEQPQRQSPKFDFKYRKAEGKYESAVRIRCEDKNGQTSLGSGVVVRWGGKILVVTARHVIVDAKRVFVIVRGTKNNNARVISTSAWDCAVLQTEDEIQDINPARLITQDELDNISDESLSSCGFGDQSSKFAVNTGRFIGYNTSNKTNDGMSDWMTISGPARGGDSGGPIFTSSGKVAGILWGTNNETVIGVQAARVAITLNEAVKNCR
jgi:S1-C subfamily serine protease